MNLPSLVSIAAAVILLSCSNENPPSQPAPSPTTHATTTTTTPRRGLVQAIDSAPATFPHRIWAAADFESQLPDYAWFGQPQTTNIPQYAGNATALASQPSQYAVREVGMNPVPGPRMGHVNHFYCRYHLTGATEAIFQHFSLTREDNNHIRVTGLAQDRWSQITLNFTRDALRNDGSPEAFANGERMDDLKIFLGKRDDTRPLEMLIDDVIFFSQDPNLPPENEPFPNRVIYLAAFDTGINEQNPPDKQRTHGRYKYWPGELEIVSKPQDLPPDTYWAVAKAVPRKDAPRSKWIRLMIDPPKPVGQHTKLRFRYHLVGATELTAQIFDATDNDNRHVVLKNLTQNQWTTTYVDFTRDGRKNDGRQTPFAPGHKVDDLFFFVTPARDTEVNLLIDEVVLFDAAVNP